VAQHILLTGSDEYREQFNRYLENPQGEQMRAALSLSLTNGGYLLPFVLDPTIILTNTSSANPWRRISNIKQTTSTRGTASTPVVSPPGCSVKVASHRMRRRPSRTSS